MIAPDVAEEVVGYRAWRVVGRDSVLRGPRLQSIVSHTEWPAGAWLHAVCTQDNHPDDGDVPHNGRVYCGIHAARHRPHLATLGYSNPDSDRSRTVLHLSHNDVFVVGEVGLAGKVIRGDQGWRAAKGRVRRLWVPHLHWQLVGRLRDVYQVPVHLTNVLKEK